MSRVFSEKCQGPSSKCQKIEALRAGYDRTARPEASPYLKPTRVFFTPIDAAAGNHAVNNRIPGETLR